MFSTRNLWNSQSTASLKPHVIELNQVSLIYTFLVCFLPTSKGGSFLWNTICRVPRDDFSKLWKTRRKKSASNVCYWGCCCCCCWQTLQLTATDRRKIFQFRGEQLLLSGLGEVATRAPADGQWPVACAKPGDRSCPPISRLVARLCI